MKQNLVIDASDVKGLIRKMQEALIWCGGSNDFSPEGKAYKGWLKIVLPVLDSMEDWEKLEDQMSNRTWLEELLASFWQWLAYRLPHDLVYYVVVRAGENAIAGEWSNEQTPTIRDILICWHTRKYLKRDKK